MNVTKSHTGGGYDYGYGDTGYEDMGGYGAHGSRGRGGQMGGMMGVEGAGGRGGGTACGMMGSMDPFVSQTGHSVHMRGLPYSATENDILSVQHFYLLVPYLVLSISMFSCSSLHRFHPSLYI